MDATFWKQLGWTFGITLIIGLVPTTIFLLPFFLRWLAEEDEDRDDGKKAVLFATVKEGRARPIEWNNKFHHFIMSYAGHCFAGELPDPRLTTPLHRGQEEYWEVVKDPRLPTEYSRLEKILNIPAYQGLHFMGPPYIAQIPSYRFGWIEWSNPKESNGKLSITKAPIPHEEHISHILVQGDVYFVQVPAAETKEGVAVDINMLFTIIISNPYKARYKVQNWLETVTNQAEADVRTFVGTEKILDILTVTAGNEEGTLAVTLSERSRQELETMLADRLQRFKVDYGVTVGLSQIQSVEPSGPDAGEIRKKVAAKFFAEMDSVKTHIDADAAAYKITTEAKAEREATEMVFSAAAAIPGGPEMYRDKQVGGLKQLNTLVQSDPRGNRPTIAIPTGRP